MIRMIVVFAVSLARSGCPGGGSPPPVTAMPTSAPACEAMRPGFPVREITYDGKADTPQTVNEVIAANGRARSLNARFAATCPGSAMIQAVSPWARAARRPITGTSRRTEHSASEPGRWQR